MKQLLIVFHSQSGNTRALAEAVASGAKAEPSVHVSLKPAFEADVGDLLGADGLIIGTPENLGYMSGAIKDFFDRTYYAALDKVAGKPYAVFISAGNDGSGAAREISRIANGYRFKAVAEALVVKGKVDADALRRCEELGETFATALAVGIF